MLVIYALVFFPACGYSEVEITSTASRGYACPRDHVSYYCNATGSLGNLIWQLNGMTIHFYVSGGSSFTQTHQESNSVSALFSDVSVTESFSSELSFLTLPSKSFTVECFFGGSNSNVSTTVVGDLIPPCLSPYMEYNSPAVNVSWNHNSSFIQYYRVKLNGIIKSEVRDTSAVLILPSCNGSGRYELEVIAVDVCDNEAGAMSTIKCEDSRTSSNLGQNITVLTVQPQRENAIYGIVTAMLTLLVLWIVGSSAAMGVFGYFYHKHYLGDTSAACEGNSDEVIDEVIDCAQEQQLESNLNEEEELQDRKKAWKDTGESSDHQAEI